MKLCRVKGNVTSTMKHKSFKGHKCLICQPVDDKGNDIGELMNGVKELGFGFLMLGVFIGLLIVVDIIVMGVGG